MENLIFIGGQSSISNLQVQNLTGLTPMEIAFQESMGIPRSKLERLKPYSEKDVDLSNFDIDTPLSENEKELVRLVNEYRVSKGLNPMAVSKSLTFVSRTHCKDQILNYKSDWTDERGIPANLHSWSDKGDWTPVMYTADHKYASGMWDKPSELTPYKSSGYEISFRGGFTTPSLALTGWQNSPGHNDVIIGKGFWKDLKIMGVSIHDGFSNIWFGTDESDPAGFHMTIENNN